MYVNTRDEHQSRIDLAVTTIDIVNAMYVNRRHEHPCPELDSTPRLQQTSGFRPACVLDNTVTWIYIE
jgi:hypothetical protein